MVYLLAFRVFHCSSKISIILLIPSSNVKLIRPPNREGKFISNYYTFLTWPNEPDNKI